MAKTRVQVAALRNEKKRDHNDGTNNAREGEETNQISPADEFLMGSLISTSNPPPAALTAFMVPL